MTSARSISGREFISDIRSGMTATELIAKYGLSEEELRALFIQLQGAGAKPLQLYGRSPVKTRDQASSRIRFSHRHTVPWTVQVVDTLDAEIEGVLVDLTEHGLCVRGIETYLGEVRMLTIKSESFFPVNPIPIRATCRWVGQMRDPTNYAAGFQITHISQEGSRDLRRLIGIAIMPEIELYGWERAVLTSPSDSAMKSDEVSWTCPFCRAEQPVQPQECPQCGIVVAQYQGAADPNEPGVQKTGEENLSIHTADDADRASLVVRGIVVPEAMWKRLVSLGGEVNEHVIRALNDYLVSRFAS